MAIAPHSRIMRTSLFLLSVLAAVPATASAQPPAGPQRTDRPEARTPGVLDVTSPAFRAYEAIPIEYTCEGTNATPPLTWSPAPAGTQSIAILVDDPDAPQGTFTHWLVTGIPPTVNSLDKRADLPQGAVAANNSFGRQGYGGPCPDSGRHRYFFRVFALDANIPPPANKAQFLSAIEGHVLAEGVLIGTYQEITPN